MSEDLSEANRRQYAVAFIAGAVTASVCLAVGWELSQSVNGLSDSAQLGYMIGLVTMFVVWKANEHLPNYLEKVIRNV